MVEAFLTSVLNGVNELGWASAKKIAAHTEWAVEEVLEALQKLESDDRILMRKKGRGHQYGPLVEKAPPSKKVDIATKPRVVVDATPPEPSDVIFPTLDALLLDGSQALPKNYPYNAEDFAEALLAAFPKSPWSAKEVLGGISKLVRLQRVELHPYTEGATLKYQYAVK